MSTGAIFRDLREALSLPRVKISLKFGHTSNNDPFFATIVRQFFDDATRRHRRFPLVRNLEYGVALFALPDKPEDYFQAF